MIGKLVYNAACMPTEAKYKSVKASNAKISSAILQTPGALPAMKALGWELEDEMLVCKRAQSMAQVRTLLRPAPRAWPECVHCNVCAASKAGRACTGMHGGAGDRLSHSSLSLVLWLAVLPPAAARAFCVQPATRASVQFRDVEAAKAALRKELRKEEVAKLRTAEVRIAA